MFRAKTAAIIAFTAFTAALVEAQAVRVDTPQLPATWDWLAGTFWYVGASDVPAYLYDTRAQSGAMVPDQTVFHITESKGGYFRGSAVVEIAMSRSSFTMLGVVTPDGSVLLNFLPTDPVGVPTTGTGRFTYLGRDLTMLNQMSSSPNERVKVLHWAYMRRTSPGDASWDRLPAANVSVPEFLSGR
jgi:hypothetical protein